MLLLFWVDIKDPLKVLLKKAPQKEDNSHKRIESNLLQERTKLKRLYLNKYSNNSSQELYLKMQGITMSKNWVNNNSKVKLILLLH